MTKTTPTHASLNVNPNAGPLSIRMLTQEGWNNADHGCAAWMTDAQRAWLAARGLTATTDTIFGGLKFEGNDGIGRMTIAKMGRTVGGKRWRVTYGGESGLVSFHDDARAALKAAVKWAAGKAA